MFFQKKKGWGEGKEHKYIFLCLHHLYTEGRNGRGVAGKGGCLPNPRHDKCRLQSPRAKGEPPDLSETQPGALGN